MNENGATPFQGRRNVTAGIQCHSVGAGCPLLLCVKKYAGCEGNALPVGGIWEDMESQEMLFFVVMLLYQKKMCNFALRN